MMSDQNKKSKFQNDDTRLEERKNKSNKTELFDG